MSNEVFMELFEYYDFYSLFWSFSSLNARFDALLARCHTGFDLNIVTRSDFIHFFAHTLPKINPDHIRSFHASNSTHHLFSLAHDHSLVHFAQIRSLRLCNTSLDVIQYMMKRVHFYRLERVSIDQDERQRDLTWCSKHFLNPNQYPLLKTYNDPFGDLIIEGTSVLPIEYMVTKRGSWNTFLDLLRRSPRLESLQMHVVFYHNRVRPSLMHTNNVFTRLHLNLESTIPMPILMDFFQHAPRLRKLHVNSYDCCLYDNDRNYALADPHWWENVMSKYLPELERLFLQVSSHNPSNDPNWQFDSEYTVLKQIENSSYWQSHNWRLEYKTYVPSYQNLYLTATFAVH